MGLTGVLLLALALHAQAAGALGVADALLWGASMPPQEATADLPRDIQLRLAEYRQRERMFQSGLKPPPGATDLERELFEKRVAIERVLFCLFPRTRNIAQQAAAYASDADVSPTWEGQSDPARREAAFIDGVLSETRRNTQTSWIRPYLHLVAGHRKLCASQLEGGGSRAEREALGNAAQVDLGQARDAGQPLIRLAAAHLLATGRCNQK